MTTPSGDPYQYGDDTVAARLEVDLPQDAVQNLSELSRLTADIRANMEATAKYNQDYLEYLRELPNAIGEVDTAQSAMAEHQSAIFGGGSEPIRDPFATRDYSSSSAPGSGQAGSGRPMRSYDQDTLRDLARNNPRQIANMAADRGLDDYFDDDQSYILPRPDPDSTPRPGAGRRMQFASGTSGPPNAPRSDTSGSSGPTGRGRPMPDDADSVSPGRQVGPQGSESKAERAAQRLLDELDAKRDTRDLGERARDFGRGIEGNSLLNFLTTEGGVRGRGNWGDIGGGLGRMMQNAGQGFQKDYENTESKRSELLSSAAEVAASNPALAAKLQSQASALGSKAAGMGRLLPLAKGAGVVGGVALAGAGINKAIQNTGEWAHDIQGEGVQMGGGFSEGLAFEAQVRTMAMNPFISTEQSRKIMQSALQTGYTGKEMDTMTEFMAENLKEMNMEVAQSTQLLKQNVLKGGQDTEALQGMLSQNVALAGETNMTTDQINDLFTRLAGQAIDQGASGQDSAEMAQQLAVMFEGNEILKENGSQILFDMLNKSPEMQKRVGQLSGASREGISPAGMTQWLSENMTAEETSDLLLKGAGQILLPYAEGYASGDEGRRSWAITNAQNRLKRQGIQVTRQEAEEMLRIIASGEITSMAATTGDKIEDAGGGEMEARVGHSAIGDIQTLGLGSWDELKAKWHRGNAKVRLGWNKLFGDDQQVQNAQENYDSRHADAVFEDKMADAIGSSMLTGHYPKIFEDFAKAEHGGKVLDVTIKDEEGNERKLTADDIRNKEFMEKMKSGDIQVQSQDYGFLSLQEWSSARSGTELGGRAETTEHIIGFNEETSRYLREFGTRNRAQDRADRGRGTRNSSEAGDEGYGARGRGGG